jgi:Zn-dependent M28 family amino/carboxypeptidase
MFGVTHRFITRLVIGASRMVNLPKKVVGDAYTSAYSWKILEDLVDIGDRMAGHEGETEAAEVMSEAFFELGLRDVETDEFDVPGWTRGSAELYLSAPRPERYEQSHELIGLPNSPSGDIEGTLVDVGYGLPDDFDDADLDGAIVLASSITPDHFDRFVHRNEKYLRAVDEGAAGFVFYNHLDGSLPPTGTVGRQATYGEIPAVGASKEVGQQLSRYCERDEPVSAALTVDCELGTRTSRNVDGVLGPDTDEEVLVTAHIDAHDIAEGARDNGVGCALVAEIARLCSKLEADLETAVRFVTFGSEEIGLLGAYHWADTHDTSTVKCVVNIDGSGHSRTIDVNTYGFGPLREAFEETAAGLRLPMTLRSEMRAHGDQWAMVQEGVPGVMVHSESDESGRGWGHTHADTLDKLDVRDLRDLAATLTSVVVTLAEQDRQIESKSVRQIRDEIDQGNETEMKMTGRWPEG